MILVTGGTGFLGSVLIKKLIDRGRSVIATKRENSIIPESLKFSSLVEWVDADIVDYFALAEIIPQVSAVYHCAAMVSFLPGQEKTILHTNIEGSRHIVNLCLEHQKRLTFVSSIAALGANKTNKPLTEHAKWEYSSKSSIYGISKYESEMEVWRGIQEGLDAVIINPSVMMGVGLGSGKVAANAIFDQVKKGLKIYPSGSVGVVDVDDVAEIMIRLMNSDISAERFILNSENLLSKDLLDTVSDLFGRPRPTIKASKLMLSIAWRLAKIGSVITRKRPILSKDSARAAGKKLIFDNLKIRNTLNYTFRPVQETLQDVYQAYYSKN